MVVYVKTSAWGRVECELRGLLDDKLHFIKTVCVEANTTIRILGSNPLSASALLLFLHVRAGGRNCIVCHKVDLKHFTQRLLHCGTCLCGLRQEDKCEMSKF